MIRSVLCLGPLAALLAAPVFADEGMWTFDNPPTRLLQEKYRFTPTQQWLDHVRLSCVRLNDGGSGSFVSPNGLLLTNHHVARGQLQKNSTKDHDYVKDGFYAATPEQEMKSPDLEVNVLVSLENVTAQVNAAVGKAKSPGEEFAARKAAIAGIESESQRKTGLRSDVVTLYQGGEYWLYRYQKYTDVRLVFAPEQQTAFFGGDPDNFTYPRYDLDMALFRVYDNGKPLQTKEYLKWNAKGAGDGELAFVVGHPGSTQRNDTMAQLELERDTMEPAILRLYKDRIAVLRRYSALGRGAGTPGRLADLQLREQPESVPGPLPGPAGQGRHGQEAAGGKRFQGQGDGQSRMEGRLRRSVGGDRPGAGQARAARHGVALPLAELGAGPVRHADRAVRLGDQEAGRRTAGWLSRFAVGFAALRHVLARPGVPRTRNRAHERRAGAGAGGTGRRRRVRSCRARRPQSQGRRDGRRHWHQAGRPGVSQAACRGRRSCRGRLHRPHDRAGAPARPDAPRTGQVDGGQRRQRGAALGRATRQGALRGRTARTPIPTPPSPCGSPTARWKATP